MNQITLPKSVYKSLAIAAIFSLLASSLPLGVYTAWAEEAEALAETAPADEVVTEDPTSDPADEEEAHEEDEVVEDDEDTEEDASDDEDLEGEEPTDTEEGSEEPSEDDEDTNASSTEGAEEKGVISNTIEKVGEVVKKAVDALFGEDEVTLTMGADSIATIDTVELGKTYVAPQDSQVKVTFTKLPETPGSLSIEQVILTDEQVAALGALSNVAYDITSNMENGTFAYDLELPKPEGAEDASKVVYAESQEELENAQPVSEEKVVVDSEKVQVAELDHFTIFVVVNPAPSGTACVDAGATTGSGCYNNIPDAVAAATAGDTIKIKAGTYTISSTVTINKSLTIEGEAGAIIEVSGSTYSFLIDGAGTGTTIRGLTFKKTDKVGEQNIIGIQANDVTIENNTFDGNWTIGEAHVARALEISSHTGFNVTGNTFEHLRQPAYVNAASGVVSNNHTHDTKGWVIVSESDINFTGNTWGTNVLDIAIIKNTPVGVNNYPDSRVVQMSDQNNDAVVENQYGPVKLLSDSYVIAVANGNVGDDGSKWNPYTDLQSAVNRIVDGGTVHLNADRTVTSMVTIDSPLILEGGGHTVLSGYVWTSNSNNAGIGIIGTNNVTIKNLVVDGGGAANALHGINIYETNGVILDGVTVKNNGRSGVSVNSSDVTVNNITTENNSWHGINVDKRTSQPAKLTVNGVSSHSDILHIYVDDTTKDVTVVDTNNQYVSEHINLHGTHPNDLHYYLTPNPDPTNQHQLNLSGSVYRDHKLNDCTGMSTCYDQGENLGTGWTVNLYEDVAGTWQFMNTAMTNASGTFSFPTLYEAGTYYVCLEINDGWTQQPQNWSGTPYHLSGVNASGNTDEGPHCRVISYDDTADKSNKFYFGVVDTKKPVTEVISPDSGNTYKTVSLPVVEATSNDGESGLVQVTMNLYGPTGLIKSCVNQPLAPAVATKDFSCDLSTLSSYLANDGDYYLKINSKDAGGNVSNTVTWNFTIDNGSNPPTVTFVAPTPSEGEVVSGVITGKVLATDDEGMGSYYLRFWKGAFESGIDNLVGNCQMAPGGSGLGTEEEATCDFDTTAHPDGVYVFSAQFQDSHIQWGQALRTFVVDNTDPTAPTITKPTPRQWFRTTPIATQWTPATDANGIEKYQVAYAYDDGHTIGASTCTDVTTIDGKNVSGCRDASGTSRGHVPGIGEQGGVTVWVRAIDNAGNAGPWSKSVHYYYDATAPVTTLVTPTGMVGNTFTVSGEATDNLSLNRVYVQLVHRQTSKRYGGTTIHLSGTAQDWSKTFDATALGLPEGDYAAHVSVTDNAGNTSSVGWSDNFSLDLSAPDVMITFPSNGDTVNGTIDLKGTIEDSNLWRYFYSVAGTSKTVYADDGFVDQVFHTWDTTSVPDGSYTIRLEARDKANNKDAGSVSTITVIVDNEDDSTPTTLDMPVLLSPADGAVIGDNTPSFDWDPISYSGSSVVHYEFELSTNADFTDLVPDANQYSELTAADFPGSTSPLNDGTYYWRVRACEGAVQPASVCGNWVVWSFVVDTDTTDDEEENTTTFRSSSGGGRIGTFTTTGPLARVLGASTDGDFCVDPYLTANLGIGLLNLAPEVVKLQNFLNTHMNASLPVTGVFGELTRQAVMSFQAKYAADILAPWGISTPTGMVYHTTKKKINEMACDFQREFPLTQEQLDEINSRQGQTSNTVGQTTPSAPKSIVAGASTTIVTPEPEVEEDIPEENVDTTPPETPKPGFFKKIWSSIFGN